MQQHICDSGCTHRKLSSRPFLQLHTHDNVSSTRDASAPIEEMFKICSKENMGYASTNHGWGASFVQMKKMSKKYNVKPVYGIEFYLSLNRNRIFEIRRELEDLKNLKNLSKEEKLNVDEKIKVLNYEFEEIKRYNHICVIAKNEHGFRNIIDAHNIASLYGFYGKPLVTLEDLFGMPKDSKGDRGIIVTSACLSGVIPRDIMNGNYNMAKDHALFMKEELGDDWYLEVQPHELEEQKIVNKEIIKLSRETNIHIVVGTDSHYLSSDYARSHEIFLLLQGEQKVADIGKKLWRVTYETPRGETRRKKVEFGDTFMNVDPKNLSEGILVSKKNGITQDKYDALIKKVEEVNKVWMIEGADLSFKTQRALLQKMNSFDELKDIAIEAIENNKDIYEKIEDFDWDFDLKLPVQNDADDKLFQFCVDSLKEKKLLNKKIYADRFKTEFKTIKNGGLSNYFLVLKDIIDYAKSRNIPVGPGRGSAGSSLVVYLLGITRIDPLLWDFPFERFLNEKRSSGDNARIRVSFDDKNVRDFLPNDIIKLKDGREVLAKDLKGGDEI